MAHLQQESRNFSRSERLALDALVRRVRAGGCHDERVLSALAQVPRHVFMPGSPISRAYRNSAEPIGYGQTISQPSMIALMLRELQIEPHHRVLEVGAGCGYAAALLSRLAGEVFALEIVPELAQAAEKRLAALGYDNVRVLLRDGYQGFAEGAPFDRILVSAAPPSPPPALLQQLARGGRIALPVGDAQGQELVIGTKGEQGKVDFYTSAPCIFVPLVHPPESLS